jgi:hypothetical protein
MTTTEIRHRWVVTVQYVVDGTTTERVFTGARVSTQVFGGRVPRKAAIKVCDESGDVVEVFQCNVMSIHKRREVAP